jgi:hypothetical protein
LVQIDQNDRTDIIQTQERKKKVFEYDENVEIVKKMGKKMKEKIQPKNNK